MASLKYDLNSISEEIEILISTIYQENLIFLDKMFQYNDPSDFKILIINQTTRDKVLRVSKKNIRVVNCFEFSVPKSRNLALKEAEGDICVMADDDIIYEPNLKRNILDAYRQNSNADMISFEAKDETGKKYTNYYPEGSHTKKSLKKIYTWVITFKRATFKLNQIYYNDHFGFGETFKGHEEYVFLRNALDKELMMVHKSKTIVMHPDESSGKLMGSNNAIYATSALYQRFYGNLSYLLLAKYIFFLLRHNYIHLAKTYSKFSVGLEGIMKYKKMNALSEIN